MKRLLISIFVLLMLAGCVSVRTYSGELNSTVSCKDEALGVEAAVPILIRTVEMVQYKLNDSGELELVFSNKPIVLEGEVVVNPSFPEDLSSEVFYSDAAIGDVLLSEEVIKELAYGDLATKKELILSLNDEVIDHNLLLIDNAYVSRSDDYQLGEIRVTYSYVEPQNLTIKGKVVDGYLTIGR